MERLTEYEQDEFDGTVIAAPKYERTQMGDADLKEWVYRAAAKLAYYEDCEEQGKVIELPLAEGDTLYEISYDSSCVSRETVSGFAISKQLGTYILLGIVRKPILAANLGRMIFRTREEAEAKLAEINKEK